MTTTLSNTTSVRTFLSIPLPSLQRARLAALESTFIQRTSVIRWTRPSSLHITVCFIGEVPRERLGQVEEAAREAAANVSPFALRLAGLGAFPNDRLPRVLWVGLERSAAFQSLCQLAGAANDALAKRDFIVTNHSYSPHITVARVPSHVSVSDRQEVGRVLETVKCQQAVDGAIPVPAMDVMRSELHAGGPRYTVLANVPLGMG